MITAFFAFATIAFFVAIAVNAAASVFEARAFA
jgi:hypothetical protein